MTWVSRSDRCFTALCAVWERTEEDICRMVRRESPSATTCYNDAFALYETAAIWRSRICLIRLSGEHQRLPSKRAADSVEAGNSELRHCRTFAYGECLDLARLARRTRCFSRCMEALRRAIDLFVWDGNRRQHFKRGNPTLPASIQDFITPTWLIPQLMRQMIRTTSALTVVPQPIRVARTTL